MKIFSKLLIIKFAILKFDLTNILGKDLYGMHRSRLKWFVRNFKKVQ